MSDIKYPEIVEAKRKDVKDKLHNSVIDEEIEVLQEQIQRLHLMKKGHGLMTEKAKLISTPSIFHFVNQSTKFLLSRMNKNSKNIGKGGMNDCQLLNEQILLGNALSLKSIKSSKHLHEIESFTNRDLLLERSQLIL